jgi:hypothetical protein
VANTVYEKLLYLTYPKAVAFLQTSEFPLEIPRSQNRNFQYTTTLGTIKKIVNENLFSHFIINLHAFLQSSK